MATQTSNFNLTKPELGDNITPTIFAENFQIIDEHLGCIRSATCAITASGWTGSAAPYTQQVTVQGMVDSWVPGVPVAVSDESTSNDTLIAIQEALGCITLINSSTDTLTFVCSEDKPTIDIKVKVPGVMM